MVCKRSTLATLTLVCTLMVLIPGCTSAATICNRYASTSGRDSARGSAGSPYRSVQRLVRSLHAGQTGCLESGTYYGDVKFVRGGKSGRPLTLRAAPGANANVVGHLYVPQHSDWVRVSGLSLDGQNPSHLPSPTVDSSHAEFLDDNVTNDHTGICFELGSGGGYGQARDTLIQYSKIHDCGTLPRTNEQHGIYVANSVGARILDNWIYNNADRGIQLYWNAQHTTIAANVIDRNGEGIIISGGDGDVSSHNLIVGNAITNSTARADVESYWPTSARGHDNLVVGNCVYGGERTIDPRGGGFKARDNPVLDPQYADPAAGNYSLASGTVCQRLASDAKDSPSAARASAIVRAAHAAGAHLSLWVHVKVSRHGRDSVLFISGGPSKAGSMTAEWVVVDLKSHRRWHRIAAFRAARDGGFSLMHQARGRARGMLVRVTARFDAMSGSATARA
jgi:Right handed beta helix region